MDTEQAHSKEREATKGQGKGVGRAEQRKRQDGKLTNREEQSMNKKRGRSDVEIDRRVFQGHTVVLLEDRSMLKPDGTSGQYIIAIESTSKAGKLSLVDKRYISDLITKLGYAHAYEGARVIFLNPKKFRGILDEHWTGYENDQTGQ
jgi:hypothetical protein